MANGLFIEDLCAGYGAVSVLRDVFLEVRAGELVALLGTNGNGKSTLLSCIVGIVKPTRGRISLRWDGVTTELTNKKTHEIINCGVAYVPEGRKLAPDLTVEDNLLLAGSGRRARANTKQNLEFCYDMFPVLAERRRQIASSMSGGQQQMLAIARALMTSPFFLVIDEPSVGLAPIVVDQVLAIIERLQKSQNLTVLMAEQSFFQAVDIASRAYVLSHGKITHEFDRFNGSQEEVRKAMLGGSV